MRWGENFDEVRWAEVKIFFHEIRLRWGDKQFLWGEVRWGEIIVRFEANSWCILTWGTSPNTPIQEVQFPWFLKCYMTSKISKYFKIFFQKFLSLKIGRILPIYKGETLVGRLWNRTHLWITLQPISAASDLSSLAVIELTSSPPSPLFSPNAKMFWWYFFKETFFFYRDLKNLVTLSRLLSRNFGLGVEGGGTGS